MSYNRNIAYLAYEYEGYKYEPWEDKDDDVIKIWHDIKTPGGHTVHGPWSPYVTPTLEQFIDFVLEWEYGKADDSEEERTLKILADNRKHYG